jgi:hypothetical protein
VPPSSRSRFADYEFMPCPTAVTESPPPRPCSNVEWLLESSATDLALAGYRPMVLNMSLGGPLIQSKAALTARSPTGHGHAAGSAGGRHGFPGAYAP